MSKTIGGEHVVNGVYHHAYMLLTSIALHISIYCARINKSSSYSFRGAGGMAILLTRAMRIVRTQRG